MKYNTIYEMIELDKNKLVDGVYYLSSEEKQNFDDDIYIELRKKEGRLYSDDQLSKLPYIKLNNNLDKEWKVRSKTFEKLLKYFSKRENQNILEIGCGNGWLSNGISSQTNNFVLGVDLNKTELLQAARVFKTNSRVKFAYANVYEETFPPHSFDAVIFASSIQYFRDLFEIIDRTFYFLKNDEEIHIVDSNLYKKNEIEAAKLRTEKYYKELGFPGMSRFYHHHLVDDLKNFKYKKLNQRSINWIRLRNKFSKDKIIIFPWIRIIKL